MSNLLSAINAIKNKNLPKQSPPPVTSSQTAYNPVSASNQRQSAFDLLATTIKTERKAKGWTQRDLASKCGYSQGTITRAENNMWISLTCLTSIANALGKKINLT